MPCRALRQGAPPRLGRLYRTVRLRVSSTYDTACRRRAEEARAPRLVNLYQTSAAFAARCLPYAHPQGGVSVLYIARLTPQGRAV